MAGEGGSVDAVYYRDGASNRLAMRVLVAARRAMLDLFMREMRPTRETRILDIGVSDEENEGANFLEKGYPHPENITCAGIGTGEALGAAYPAVGFVRIVPGAPLPFPDGTFDVACSNAVLEHVGGPAARRAFVLEQLRVARAVFLTVPNRWFPVEHHTGLPLLHWSPALFRRTLAGTRFDHWTRFDALDFLDGARLRAEWPSDVPVRIVATGVPLGPLSSNLALIARGPG
jgi:SAM-dependent methyltransferase